MKFPNFLKSFVEQGVQNRAVFLKNIAVCGWVLSSFAQTCGIIFNDKIPAKEKRFLVPQEIFDGLINATLFWFVTSKATNFGKKLVLNKKILPKKYAEIFETFKPNCKNLEELNNAFTKHIDSFGKSIEAAEAKNFVEGMGVITCIGGAIIANNIITPIVRNKLAGICQKKEMEKIGEKTYLNPNFGNIDYNKYNYIKNRTFPTFASTHI